MRSDLILEDTTLRDGEQAPTLREIADRKYDAMLRDAVLLAWSRERHSRMTRNELGILANHMEARRDAV